MEEINRGHIEYIRKLQKARTMMVPSTEGTRRVFEWIVQDALLDPDNRQPSYWEMDGGVSFVEYVDSGGHVKRVTLGKYVIRNGTGDWTENDVSIVRDMLSGVSSYKEKHFKILEGDEITQAYRDNIDGGDGCMRGDCSPYTRWYGYNGVRMLTHRNKARALLWELDSGELFLDRIYPNSGAHLFAFEMWAKIHGALIRSHQGAPSTRVCAKPPFEVNYPARCDISVTMKDHPGGLYPYMDTFSYLSHDIDGARTCTILAGDSHYHRLHNIEGGGLVRPRRCEMCSNRLVLMN